MKRIVILLIILIISISPLFRGLFFLYESSVFFMSISMLAAIYFFIKWIKKEEYHFNKWFMALGLLLILAYLLSFINAANSRQNLETLTQYIVYLIAALILYDYFYNKKERFSVIIMMPAVFVGLICAIVGIEALTGAFPILEDTLFGVRIGSTFQYTNTAAIYFVVCIIFSITLINTAENMFIKAALAGAGNILFFALVLTVSRGGYLIGFIVLLIFLFLLPKGFKKRGIAFLACMVLPALLFVSRFITDAGSHDYMPATKWLVFSFLMAFLLCLFLQMAGLLIAAHIRATPVIRISLLLLSVVAAAVILLYLKAGSISFLPQYIVSRVMSFSLTSGSFIDRITFDKDALKLLSSRWMLGLGGGGWSSLYQSVQESFYTAREVHNNYLQIFVEAGILGFVSYTLLVILSVINLLKYLSKVADLKQKVLVSGVFCSFLGLALHSSFDFDLSYPSIALLFWALMAVGAVGTADSGVQIKMGRNRADIICGGKLASAIFIPIVLATAAINGIFAGAAYNAEKGEDYLQNLNYKSAMIYYEKAYRLDSFNPEYTFELAKLYNFFAANNTNPENIREWRKLALGAVNRSISLDRYTPAYREVLARTCSDAGMPLEALEQLIRLVEYQPCNSSNYVLLAEGYLEAADYYINNKEERKAIDLLIACSEIDKNKFVNKTSQIIRYRDKAINMLEEINAGKAGKK